jgi:hypothetical protein
MSPGKAAYNEDATVVGDGQVEAWKDSSEANPPGAQILGVAVLEFGIVFHSVGSGQFSLDHTEQLR